MKDRIYHILLVLCVAVVAVDLFITRKTYFDFEGLLGFHAWFGFIACVGLVLVAKQLRKILKRPEDYYDR